LSYPLTGVALLTQSRSNDRSGSGVSQMSLCNKILLL
jgi:hypothetical protein